MSCRFLHKVNSANAPISTVNLILGQLQRKCLCSFIFLNFCFLFFSDDYRTLLGERIPYHKLGHKSLELFIQSVPSLITSRGPNGEMFVDAQVSEKTAHISSMVQKQKTAAPKKKVRITQAPRFNRAVTQPPPNTTKWRPKRNPYVGAPRKTYQQSSRLSAVSHNQFVSGGGYARPRVPSKVVVPERSEVNAQISQFYVLKHHFLV